MADTVIAQVWKIWGVGAAPTSPTQDPIAQLVEHYTFIKEENLLKNWNP